MTAARLAFALTLIAAACTAAPAPSSEIAFSSRSWPEAEAAPCVVGDGGAARLGIARIEAIKASLKWTEEQTYCNATAALFGMAHQVMNFKPNMDKENRRHTWA